MSIRRAAIGVSLVAVLAVPSGAAGAVPASDAPAASAAATCKKIVKIGGKRRCLAVGKRCVRKYEKQYLKHGFSCRKTTRRLVVSRQSF